MDPPLLGAPWFLGWYFKTYVSFSTFYRAFLCGSELTINVSYDILTRVFLSYLTTLYSMCFINFRKSLVSSLETGLFTSLVMSTTYFLFSFFYLSSSYGLKHLLLWVRPLTWCDALDYVVKWPPNKVNNNLENQKSGLVEPWPRGNHVPKNQRYLKSTWTQR